jgi:long-subunit acyl-CoA synthetase (AMP-forming)
MFPFRSLCEAFQQRVAADADRIALRTPDDTVTITWGEYAARVRAIAAGLAALGVRRGDTVGLMMVNRPEFALCDTAALHLGATPFSVYNTFAPEQIAHVFANAGNRVVICEAQFADRVRRAGGAVEHVVCIDDVCIDDPAQGTMSLAELEQRGRPGFDFDAAWQAVGPEDVLTVIYTSGTTGPPKGVELTHANALAELRAITAVLPVRRGERVLSYLPSAHVSDRTTAHYWPMAAGLEVTYVADATSLPAVLPQVRPAFLFAVPRTWEKIKAALQGRLATEPDPQRRRSVERALDVGLRKLRAEQAALAGAGPGPDETLLRAYARADADVLAPIRRQLGLDATTWPLTGAAPVPIDVLEFFGALGVPIYEVWGMSELSCFATINPPGRVKLGTVGPALAGVELTLAADGELLCRTAQIMKGYRGEPGKTAETIDTAGWLHTGDVGTLDAEGYLRITDRKKEMIINTAGHNMSPANVEARLKTGSPLIGQAICVGDARPHNVALLVLDPDAAAAFATRHGLAPTALDELARHPDVLAEVADGVARANTQLSLPEQIQRWTLLDREWLPGADELTPTSKLKRQPTIHKYRREIEALYTQTPALAAQPA